MRKIALIAVMTLGLAACGGQSGDNNQVQPNGGHGGAEHGTTDNV
jgi:hypothetical protein